MLVVHEVGVTVQMPVRSRFDSVTGLCRGGNPLEVWTLPVSEFV